MKSIAVFFLKITRFAAAVFWIFSVGIIAAFAGIGGWAGIKRVTHCTRLWGRGNSMIFNVKVKYFGDTKKCLGGLIVSNHMGSMDIMIHGTLFLIRFAAKSSIKNWPVIGWLMTTSRSIWVNRSSPQKSREVLKQFQETMKHNIPLLVYPEGTSSDGRSGIRAFKSTPFESVIKDNLPVFPIITFYHDTPDGYPVAWFGDKSLVPHVWHLMGYWSLKAEIHVLETVYPEGRNRKELAQHVHDLMEEKYNSIMKEKGLKIKQGEGT